MDCESTLSQILCIIIIVVQVYYHSGPSQAKAIVVPTNDAELKARLREMGEPICENKKGHTVMDWNHTFFRSLW